LSEQIKSSSKGKVMVSTIKPISGGVPQKLRYVIMWLKEAGYLVNFKLVKPLVLAVIFQNLNLLTTGDLSAGIN